MTWQAWSKSIEISSEMTPILEVGSGGKGAERDGGCYGCSGGEEGSAGELSHVCDPMPG